MIQGLRTTIYIVDDINSAKKWYAQAFETEPYFDEPFYVGYNIGGYELGLQEEKNNKEKSSNVYTYWGVDDIDKEFKRLLKLGATSFQAPENVGDDIMVATVKDLWDNVLGIIYNPHFKVPTP
jgi:lactoylglutathione lyase